MPCYKPKNFKRSSCGNYQPKSNLKASLVFIACFILLFFGWMLAQFIFVQTDRQEEIPAFPVDTSFIRDNQTVYGYSSSVDETDSTPLITASNIKVRNGIVANNCLPFGTKVLINGQEFEVQDRMNSRYGCDTFDIWFENKQDAINHGVKNLRIAIL